MPDTTPHDNPSTDALTTITVDTAGRQVIAAALDLYQRAAIGQWNRVVDIAAVNMTFDMTAYNIGVELDETRARHAVRPPELRHPNASLAIHQAGEQARLAHDLWHALGGGMPERRNDRLTHGHTIEVGTPYAQDILVLRAAAAGRDEYAGSVGDDTAGFDDALRHEAAAYRAAADMLETGDRTGLLRDTCPSWRWNELGVDLADPAQPTINRAGR